RGAGRSTPPGAISSDRTISNRLPPGKGGFLPMVPNLGRQEPQTARKGARRLPRRESALLWRALSAAFAGAAWWFQSWRIALLGRHTWCMIGFVRVAPLCRVRTRRGQACSTRRWGRQIACAPHHQRPNNDAFWRLVGPGNALHRDDWEGEEESG